MQRGGGEWKGRVEDTQRSCIPIDTEEGFLLQPRERWEREGGRREREGEGEREHHISAMLSQHVNVMHVLIELGIFRGHVLMGSYGLKKGERLAALSTRHRDEKLPRVCRRFHDRSERLRVTVQQV